MNRSPGIGGHFIPIGAGIQHIAHCQNLAGATIEHDRASATRVELCHSLVQSLLDELLNNNVNTELYVSAVFTGPMRIRVNPKRTSIGVTQIRQPPILRRERFFKQEFHSS